MSYNGKNEQFIRAIGLSDAQFLRGLVVIELPVAQSLRREAVLAFMMAVNLLSRLFQRVHLVAPPVLIPTNPWAVKTMAELHLVVQEFAVGQVIWEGPPPRAEVLLTIGSESELELDGSRCFVSFGGWCSGLDMKVESTSDGVLAALFAACYGASQVFLHAVNRVGGSLKPMAAFSFSLLRYSLGSGADLGAQPAGLLDLKNVHLVGVGAVGSALIYTLGHWDALSGALDLIDNDRVEESNLHRYPLAVRQDLDIAKPSMGQRALKGRSLLVRPWHMTYEAYCRRKR